MPAIPAEIIAANDRYGLASAPGIRFSMRKVLSRPTTRKPTVRLSCDQAILVGAQLAG